LRIIASNRCCPEPWDAPRLAKLSEKVPAFDVAKKVYRGGVPFEKDAFTVQPEFASWD
jgi:hypothetical protein